ncbi:sugar transferase [Rossellomorea sp. YZS02]|uniref:sugar transferase n=1 Tax=Rossellomorea sp. YZS02 TaxID=3097358 RepID=UPI002A0B9153|nr:sugar transferase [Rossellomorea sp. YZS02]MDX8343247.1 sugar transferase [Rossellomorea sp. YZS02]
MIEPSKMHEESVALEQVDIKTRIDKLNSKRMMDIVISLISMILLSPIFLLIYLLIMMMDGRPVIFKQTRTGINHTPFTIYKFRTMRESNEVEYGWKDKVPDDFVFKGEHNPDITTLGKILRKTSLDELPQLLNVLKGDMSMVGPRPEVPRITRYYDEQQRQRLLVKPGMTGYAQVNGRSDMNHGQKIFYDLYYVYNQSLRLDLKILLKTIGTVLRRSGSY